MLIPRPTISGTSAEKANFYQQHFMIRLFSCLSGCLLMLNSAQAITVFTANITHDQESAPGGTAPLTTSLDGSRPLSFGDATFILNDAETELSFTATIFNIDVTGTQTPDTFDNLVAAHIHVGAGLLANAPVRWGFFGAPDNDTNPSDLVVTPFSTGVGGTFTSVWNLTEGNAGTTLTSNLPQIKAGLSYINFHTVQFSGGEIRGQITVPDGGATVLMLGLAVASLVAFRHGAARSVQSLNSIR